jgi:FtsH-binding integral membrane protein
MSQVENPYQSPQYTLAANAAADERADFITKTYLHLAGAVGVFVALEAVLLNTPGVEGLIGMMIGGRYSWLIVLGLFMFVSWIAEKWANSAVDKTTQYMGLGLYVVAEAVIFLPLVYIARMYSPGAVTAAGLTTLVLFGALTAVVFLSRADFSFLRTVLMFGGLAALVLIVLAIVVGFSLGPIFISAMIALACGYILFHTSNVLHHYRIGQHVAASLALFASVALLLWYLILLFSSRD